jgi:hypothetical protein
MKLNQDSITVNMVVKTKTPKYWIDGIDLSKGNVPETSISKIQDLIASGNFTAEYIPNTFTSNSFGTLLITEKEQE